MEAGVQDRIRRVARGAARRTRDRLALQGYAALLHGPLQELTQRIDALREDVDRAERSRLEEQERLTVSGTRQETLLEEVRALSEEVRRLGDEVRRLSDRTHS